jgi:uncharacterized protein (TIGR03089 family)
MTYQAPAALLEGVLRTDPARPLLTFYDDRTDERVELSVSTYGNWVAKTACLLVDELGAGPGDVVRLDLPRHWQTAVWAGACWRTGCVIDLDGDPAQATVAVTGPAGLGSESGPRELVALSLLPLAQPFAMGTLPAGALDYAVAVPAMPDRFDGPRPAPTDPAVRSGGLLLAGAELVDAAASLAERWGVGRGGRLLVSDPLDQIPELCAATVVPLVTGGSAVLCRHTDPGRLAAREASERVTARAT